MLDVVFAFVFVLGAVLYLGHRLKKRLRSFRDPRDGNGCSCGCGCALRKKAFPRKKDGGNA